MAKKKRIKLPKKFAGYKLSKATRRNLSWAMRLFDSPEAKTLVASGVGAVVTHFAERRAKPKRS